MSLYTYVPGKAELLDLMLDTVLGEDATAGRRRRRAGGPRLERRGPGELGPVPPAPVDAADHHEPPGARAQRDSTCTRPAARWSTGIGLRTRRWTWWSPWSPTTCSGAAQAAVEAAQAERRTGMSDEEWWKARAPLLDKYFDPGRYPTVTRVAESGAFRAAGRRRPVHRGRGPGELRVRPAAGPGRDRGVRQGSGSAFGRRSVDSDRQPRRSASDRACRGCGRPRRTGGRPRRRWPRSRSGPGARGRRGR